MFEAIKNKFLCGVTEKGSDARVKHRLAEQVAAHLTSRDDVFDADYDSLTGEHTYELRLVVIPERLFQSVITAAIEEVERANALQSLNSMAESPERNEADCERICQAILNGDCKSGAEAFNIINRLYLPDMTFSRGGIALAIKELRGRTW